MKYCVGKHIAQARASASDRFSMVAEMHRKVEGKLWNIVSGQSVFGIGSFNGSCVLPSRDIPLLPWIDAASDGNCSAMPVSDEVQAASFSWSKKDSNTSTTRSRKRCKTITMRTLSDTARLSSDDMPVTNFESDAEYSG